MLRILPREEKFFVIFAEQAGVLHEAAKILVQMFENAGEDPAERANAIKRLEHRGDTMTHDLIVRLNQTFITPLDREDIHALSSRLDDVLDLVNSVATLVLLFRLRETRPVAIDLARLLQRTTVELLAAVPNLEKGDKVLEHCREISRLEHESDNTCRKAIADLFDQERDPISLIKWKEVLEGLEEAVDTAEDVANVLENIVIKSS